MMRNFKFQLLPFIGFTGILLLSSYGCRLGSKSEPDILIPANVSLTLNGGEEATRDTVLSVEIGGDYISKMIVSADSTFSSAEWLPYDSLIYLSVSSLEGTTGVFGRFASDGGGTTSVVSDHIEIDLSAHIESVNVHARAETLATGDVVTFEVVTGEPGYAEMSFGNYFSQLKLNEEARGTFSRSITIPAGIIDDSVFSVASFRDLVGNRAIPTMSEHSLVIRGREIDPHLTGTLRIPDMKGEDCLVRGNVCFISDQYAKIHLVDVLDLEYPAYMRSIETSGWCGGMDANERILYLADGEAGVAIVGIFPPISASIIGRATVSDRTTDVELDGYNVYVSTHLSGLCIVDANDWIRPEVVARLQISGNGEIIIRNENILFIAGTPSVACVDVSDSKNPILLTEFLVDGDVLDGIYYENKLYLVTDTRGVILYDVTDPANPVLHSVHQKFRNTTSIALMAPYIVIGRESGITIANGAVPDLLPVVGSFGGLREVKGIEVSEHKIFISGDGWFYTAALYY